MMTITVAYASPQKQWIKTFQLSQGATVAQVLNECQTLSDFPVNDINAHKVGIYGHEVSLDHVVKEGDRVEIYRPLIRDPKTARRLRAQKKKA